VDILLLLTVICITKLRSLNFMVKRRHLYSYHQLSIDSTEKNIFQSYQKCFYNTKLWVLYIEHTSIYKT